MSIPTAFRRCASDTRSSSDRGAALAISLLWLSMLLMMGTGIMSYTTTSTVRVTSEEQRAIALNAADAGLDDEYSYLWRPFKISQRFADLDTACSNASVSAPALVLTGSLAAGSAYSVGVVRYQVTSAKIRTLLVRSVGWVDYNGNSALDQREPSRVVEAEIQLRLDRSKVFDYAYFVNNYGWMQGFGAADLIVNGDMRANGNFDFTGGTPTINGSVYACKNDKLIPPAAGIVNITPTHWSNAYYNAHAPQTARMAYAESRMGAKGSDEYENWRDIIYDQDAQMVRGDPAGAVIGDVNGVRSYDGRILKREPTTEVAMPDLEDIQRYIEKSQAYFDSKRKYLDGSNNPYYGEGAYVEVYNTATNRYERITTNGVYYGSAALIGSITKPIKIHGPVTITGDAVIKGVVQGQGTIYTGRNVHIVGNISYQQAPNFSGTDMRLIDKANEKKDFIGLAARGSIMMGNTKTFASTTLQYMTPPFTKARYDDDGNLIPAFNALETDSTGRMRYQSILGDDYINSIAEPVNQINAVLYTNFLGGGDIGQGGTGCTFNGSIISRDEAMILHSLPLRMNYDNRLKWRLEMGEPLIDLDLPDAPVLRLLSWNELT